MLTIRTAALVVLVTFCATPVLAQNGTVSGVVIDDRTERPIKGVLVYVEGQQTLVETDADGRFGMMAPLGPQTITASVIGYALLTTDIALTAAPIDMTIWLSEGAGAYKESVTVSGSDTSASLRRGPASRRSSMDSRSSTASPIRGTHCVFRRTHASTCAPIGHSTGRAAVSYCSSMWRTS